MADHDSKWVQQIIRLQHGDGSWGCFHTLSRPTREQPMSTEQALRRLRILGLAKGDEPVDNALAYMRAVLLGTLRPPDGREKVLNWDAFEAHMMATWIRLFDPDDSLALPIAQMWAQLITLSFAEGMFNETVYATEYRKRIPLLHKGERLIMLPQFYMVNLLKGELDRETEALFVDHIIHHPGGIYYVYGSRIADLPATFTSREASYYLAALEQLAGYVCAGSKLHFATQWLVDHRGDDGKWDMSAAAKDGVYFPLSDSWRKPEDRRNDCTLRIEKLLKALSTFDSPKC